MKRLSFVVLFIGLFLNAAALGADRAAIVQGRIQGALNNVLPKTDYLVIVNRLDDLDSGGVQAPLSGEVRNLPGLTVGVDARGEIVNKEGAIGEYNGPVAINLIVDPAVRGDTFELIRKTIPELAGGMRDLDEFKVTRAALRQAPQPNQNAPQVNVTNQAGQSGWADLVRHAAVLLLLGGILIWFMSRISNKDQKQSSPNQAQHDSPIKSALAEKLSFVDLDPGTVALYLLKQLHERRPEKVSIWAALTEPSEQRKVLKTIPGWAASYLEKQLRVKPDEQIQDYSTLASNIYREIAVVELNLVDDEDKMRSFLVWFPAASLRLVSRHHLMSITNPSKETLLKIRQDLGNLVKVDTLNMEESVAEPTAKEIHACFTELSKWKSSDVLADRATELDLVHKLARVINQLTEFGPIAQQLTQAKSKLPESDFKKLEALVVSAATPHSWPESKVKDWLRQVDPQDYQWWLSVTSTQPNWDLKKLLRPLRLSMFTRAAEEPEFKSWKEDVKKAAAVRLLEQLRTVHHQAENSSHVEAA